MNQWRCKNPKTLLPTGRTAFVLLAAAVATAAAVAAAAAAAAAFLGRHLA